MVGMEAKADEIRSWIKEFTEKHLHTDPASKVTRYKSDLEDEKCTGIYNRIRHWDQRTDLPGNLKGTMNLLLRNMQQATYQRKINAYACKGSQPILPTGPADAMQG
jgi:hypothetical protein